MIKSFRSKPLKKFHETGDSSKLAVRTPAQLRSLHRKLAFLNSAAQPEDMNLPGWGFHGLQGVPKRYSVTASANYRLTYGWQDGDAIDLDLEDYH